jgi:hypothetical protein
MISEAVLTTLLGVVIGFVLSTLNQWLVDRRKERGEAESVRVILRLEIDTNIEALRQFWAKSTTSSDGTVMEPNNVYRYAQGLIDTPFPRFKQDAFRSQLHLLAKSLAEQQILDVFRVYDDLDKVEELKNKLEEKKGDIRNVQEIGATSSEGSIVGVEFGNLAQVLWPQIENIVIPLLASGNPLKKDNKVSILRRLHKSKITEAKE